MSTGLRFTLEVDGLPPDAFAVVSFHLNQSLSSLFSLDLSLVSQQFLSLEFAQVLDKMAYLTIWQGDEVQRRVKGVVTWFELGENDKNQMLYSMKVHPPLWRAGLRQNFRIFQNEDIKSILGTMLQENGVTEWSPLFSEPHPSREFCVQYGETDYDFLCRMAAEEGIFFYEDHAYKSTDQSLVLCDTVRHLPESFEIPWNPNTRTEVSTLCISQFRYSAQIRPSSVVTKDYTFKRPGWAGRFDQEGQHQDYITQDPIGLAGGWNLYNYPLNPIIRMDPLGLYNLYQLLYDVWHDDSYGTSSIDITGSGDLISLGGHAGLGVAFAKKKGEMLSDICIYATACGHAGIGGGINAAITYSETKSLPTSGVSNSVGVTVGGGVGGHFAYTYVVDVDNPESSTESVGIGAGVDASVMTLACRTWQECWVN
ncbi:type VI secretion system tip protein TssI/VgrG [Escherichia coli]|uniref:type VI secretion system tip protein TssI/VgrG n=1 Tax=Escherichia coli TaxID=562 RepID=UPI0011862318|nr:type VI secretion system tip protein TssI/VgrG [Escherichia coli]EEY3535048.1 type VI secretion system tip protein VgrG [Escherichia coli]EEZ6010298.1 type VI secretion system tip protein VgrG [Escherichia coli O117]EHC5097815.1 type VI secretion system tip protein VgrG [Escherichia coli]TSB57332.1 type VI secretion system tip protein VgrG [Escherichia coli]